MNYILRDYPQEAVESALEFFNSNSKKNALMVLPTGSGKSLIIANIAKELNEPVIIFQPSKEILEQNYSKIKSYGVDDVSIYSASFNSKKISKITFATIGSVKSKPELFKDFKYIIVDEAHFVNAKKGMYKEFFEIVTGKIIGLTATPYRLVTDGFGGSILKFLTRTRPRIFSELIYYAQIGKLFNEGYLSKLKYYQVNGFDSSQLQINSTGNDYTDQSVRRYYDKIEYEKKIIKVVNRCLEIGRKNILIFTRFIEEAQAVKDKLGDICEIVTSETKKQDREEIIEKYRAGDIRVISNVRVLSIGFDFPELETIIDTAPTKSLALYYQKLGRGIRIHPEKEYSMIVDMCENYKRFGCVEELVLDSEKPGMWYIKNNEKQLTNVYY